MIGSSAGLAITWIAAALLLFRGRHFRASRDRNKRVLGPLANETPVYLLALTMFAIIMLPVYPCNLTNTLIRNRQMRSNRTAHKMTGSLSRNELRAFWLIQ